MGVRRACCVIGPNGVGKSTLLRCIGSHVNPTISEVWIGEHSLRFESTLAKRSLGFASMPSDLPGLLTGRQCLEIYAAAKGLGQVGREILELAEQLRFTAYLDACVDTYSLGSFVYCSRYSANHRSSCSMNPSTVSTPRAP